MIKQRNLLSVFLASSISLLSLSMHADETSPRYEFKDNNGKMTAIEDGQTNLKFSFFEDVPGEVVTSIISNSEDKDPGLTTSINTFLIQTADKTILIDAGGGTCMGDNAGRTIKALAELDIKLENVTDVLLTHAHTDHICGLMKLDSENNLSIPTYPNAMIYISEDEYSYWTQSENGESVKAIFDAYTKLNPNSIVRFKAGDTLLDQFKTIATNGHTVGHIAYLWTPSSGNEWLFWGDVMHNSMMQFAHPEITIKFDTNKEMAIETRLKTMNDAVVNNWNVAGAHLPYPGVGKISKDADNSFKWNALN